MRTPKYTSGDDFARPDINFNTDRRIIFFTGLGLPMRNQGEPFIRRFALLNHISYLALDFDAITADKTEKENFGLETAFERAMDKISKLKEERLILLGPCFGGLMAYHVAQNFPQKVESMIISSPLIDFEQGALSQHIDEVLTKRDKKLRRLSLDKTLMERMVNFHKIVLAASHKYGQIPIKSAYDGPIHILHGENDRLVPVANSFTIQNSLNRPNINIQVVSQGKHNFDISLNNKMKFSIAALKKQISR